MKNTFKNIVVICLAVIFLNLAAYGQTGTTQYVYDDNGRLTAIIAPSGETSVYEYDAAGNIVSITRQNTPIVLITSFGFTREECASTETLRITIFGTGFVSGAAQNLVTFDGATTVIESITQSEITALIPQGFISGNVRVSNVNGFAEKLLDINSLDLSARITPNGSPRSFSIVNPEQTLSLCFEGTENKNVSLLFGNVSLSAVDIRVITPSGVSILTQNSVPVNGQIFIDKQTLNESGTYYIKLSSPISQTGNLSASLYEFEDIVTTISADGTPTGVSINKPGQNAKFQFSTNGASYNLSFQNSTISAYSIRIVRNSDGQIIKDVSSLPTEVDGATGDCTIIFDPLGTATGVAALKLEPLTIRTDGTPEIIRDSAGRIFSATAGQTFNLRASNITVRPSYVGVVKPNGETLISEFIYPWYTGTSLRFTVPTNGVYTVTLSSFYPNATGSATFSLNLLNDVTGTLVINNPAANFISTLPGQSFRLSFAGNQGQRLYLKPNADDFNDLFLRIIKPDGTELLSQNISSTIAVDVNNLPATGTYTIIVQPNFVYQSGSLTLRAIDDNVFISSMQNEYINTYFYSDTVAGISTNTKSKEDSTVSQTAKDKELYSAPANLSVPTTNYLYNGTANEQFSFTPYGSGGPQSGFGFAGGTMNLYLPDGTVFDSVPLGFGVCNISLPETGTYRVEVIPEGGTQMFTFVRVCGGGGSGGGPSLTTAKPINRIKKIVKSN